VAAVEFVRKLAAIQSEFGETRPASTGQ